MNLKIKAFGMALFAVLAMSAIASQGASAHQFTSEAASTVLTATNEGNHTFSITGTKTVAVNCSIATATGTQSGASVDTVTLHPSYASCSSIADPAIEVETAGCNYLFDSDTTQATSHSTSSEHATVSVDCETSSSSNNHPHEFHFVASGCTADIGATHPANTVVNQSLHGVRFANLASHASTGKGAVTVAGTVSTVVTTTTGAPCSLLGVKEGTYSGTYTGNSIVTGFANSAASGSTTNGFTWAQHGASVDISVD